MTVRVAVPKETTADESRVALVPGVAARLADKNVEVLIQKGLGERCAIPDAAYDKARLVDDAAGLYAQADVVLKVQPPAEDEIELIREGAVLIGMMAPHRYPGRVAALRDKGVSAFAMELVPRISRAQSMDALSSQASVAGYKGALMAASRIGRFFPMLTTAAGTIRPAKVLVLGAGVAGLQAIATARRLGAMVEAYDVRAAAKEQVESLGARFVDLAVDAGGEGGYARELTEEEKNQQTERLGKHIAAADAVISTAAIPGRPSPRLISEAMVEAMKPGSVIIDLAAEGGGNCALTKPGKEIRRRFVTIYGPLNVPGMMPLDASEMYSRNLFNFLTPLLADGELKLDWTDEVVAQSAMTHDGEIRSGWIRELVEGSAAQGGQQ